jgi:hypothetical protein
MTVSRAALATSLSLQDPAALRAILGAAGLAAPDDEAPRALAERIATAIWWNYQTPIGWLATEPSLEAIVAHVARKLRVYVPADQLGWDMIGDLTRGLLADLNRRGVRVDDLSPAARARLGRRWGGAVGFGTGAAGSGAARWGSGKVLGWLGSPIGRWLPWIPKVGPWVGRIRTGATAVYVVSGPLAIALAVLSVNSALGANYQRLVPLLLGVGALGPAPVADAEEVPLGQEPAEA